MTEKASLGFVLISPSFRKCDKQDHTGSQLLDTGRPGCYLVISPSLALQFREVAF